MNHRRRVWVLPDNISTDAFLSYSSTSAWVAKHYGWCYEAWADFGTPIVKWDQWSALGDTAMFKYFTLYRDDLPIRSGTTTPTYGSGGAITGYTLIDSGFIFPYPVEVMSIADMKALNTLTVPVVDPTIALSVLYGGTFTDPPVGTVVGSPNNKFRFYIVTTAVPMSADKSYASAYYSDFVTGHVTSGLALVKGSKMWTGDGSPIAVGTTFKVGCAYLKDDGTWETQLEAGDHYFQPGLTVSVDCNDSLDVSNHVVTVDYDYYPTSVIPGGRIIKSVYPPFSIRAGMTKQKGRVQGVMYYKGTVADAGLGTPGSL